MTTISPLHLPLRAGKGDPLHFVRLTWRRFPGSLRLWRPAWTWAHGLGPAPATLISLARSEPIKVETYDPMRTDLVLAFSKVANADDALAFADRYGFLGIDQDTTAAVSMGLKAISEPALNIRGDTFDFYKGPVDILTSQREASDRLLILKQRYFSAGVARPTMVRIHSHSSELLQYVSIGDANAVFGEIIRTWQKFPDRKYAREPDSVYVAGLLVEPVSLWLEEASALIKLLDLWRAIQERNVKALGKMICPDALGLMKTCNYRPPLNDAREHVRVLKGRAPTDLLALAKEDLAQALNFHLQRSSSSTFVCVDSNGSWKLHSRPINLRAALWMQFSEIVTGTRKLRSCEICGDLMDVTNNTRSKKVHDRCSQRESMRRYRRKRNGETRKQ